jgi:hypothetical protein
VTRVLIASCKPCLPCCELPRIARLRGGTPSGSSSSYRRTTLETLLQLNVTPSQQLQASLFILAPLLSAVITALVPKPS